MAFSEAYFFKPRKKGKGLFGEPIVKYFFWVFVFIAALSFVLILYTEAKFLTFDFSADGFSRFIELFKFPLLTIGALLPILGLLAAHYRSRQMEQQNIFTNHIKYYELFHEYVEKRVNSNEEPPYIEFPSIIYNSLYPLSKQGCLTPNQTYISEIAVSFRKAKIKEQKTNKNKLKNVIESINELQNKNNIRLFKKPIKQNLAGLEVSIERSLLLSEYLPNISKLADLFFILFSFDPSIKIPSEITEVSQYNLDQFTELNGLLHDVVTNDQSL
ncbi:hypothetical protein [Spartinivicinus ruber]|uniref:hypothetical protein n=1 Tax=Spartinivicinus ruber TaxID=2683272 RepID=UPI0013D0EF00|nr:hypothetical protein [Spartinivicinus ruber]